VGTERSLVPLVPIRTLALAILLLLAGCLARSTSTYEVSRPEDRFSETIDGRTVSFANWQLAVDGKPIPIPQEKSTIVIRRSGSRLAIDVNGQTVFQD